MLQFFDAHTHTQFAAFKNDYKEVILRALANKIGLINIGTQAQTSKSAIDIALQFKDDPVYATVGLHPIHTFESLYDENEFGENKKQAPKAEAEEFDYEFYKNLALNEKVVGIGECGLDYWHIKDNAQKEKQKEVFLGHIKLCFEIKKPLMIHCRDAFSDLIEILESNKNILNNPPGVIHFFTGSKEDAKRLLNLGFYFTFGGLITFNRSYDEIIKYIPNDRILSETDAPYVSPEPFRGKRNEPNYVIFVVKKLAEIKNISLDNLALQILKNAENLFKVKLI